jgi:hypothetical protein
MHCVRVIADGATCDPGGETTVCMNTTSSCVPVGTGSTCVPDGSNNGLCRRGGVMPCDTGLTCIGGSGGLFGARGQCHVVVATGGTCDPTGGANICSPGGCRTVGATSTCQPRYTATTIATPTFIDACTTGAHIAFMGGDRDDGYSTTSVPMGFSFTFFGHPYTELWPSANGAAAMGSAEPTNLGIGGMGALPDYSSPATLAPFWDDLVVRAAPTGAICTLTTGTAPNRRFVVEWLALYAQGHTSVNLNFETVLTETSNVIDFIYSRLDPPTGAGAPFADGSNASIGLQSNRGLESATHTGTVTITTGIRFTPGF